MSQSLIADLCSAGTVDCSGWFRRTQSIQLSPFILKYSSLCNLDLPVSSVLNFTAYPVELATEKALPGLRKSGFLQKGRAARIQTCPWNVLAAITCTRRSCKTRSWSRLCASNSISFLFHPSCSTELRRSGLCSSISSLVFPFRQANLGFTAHSSAPIRAFFSRERYPSLRRLLTQSTADQNSAVLF